MGIKLYRFPNKAYRAQAIKEYMLQAGYEKAVCFSCGNASKALKAAGIETLDISPSGDLKANRWFTQAEIARQFPSYFDATSGHLPAQCLNMVAAVFKAMLTSIPDEIYLPTGSGETLVALKLAFPETCIHAVYNLDSATQYDSECVLNELVEQLADTVIYANVDGNTDVEWL